MARPGKYDHLKNNAYELWRAGGTASAISQNLKLPRTTLRGWIEQWKDGGGIPPVDSDESPQSKSQSAAEFRHPRPKMVAIDGGREHASAFVKAKRVAMEIMLDANQPGAVRIQGVNAMRGLLTLSAAIPQHVLMEEESSTLSQSTAEVEALDDEAIAQRYREMMA